MATATAARTPGQMFALVFGAVYLLVGILGMFVSTSMDADTLILFDVNVVHNIVHLAVGALWLVGSRTASAAKSVNLLIGVVYLLVAILGFADVKFLTEDLLGKVNAGDNVLHLVSGLLALYFGTAGSGARAATV